MTRQELHALFLSPPPETKEGCYERIERLNIYIQSLLGEQAQGEVKGVADGQQALRAEAPPVCPEHRNNSCFLYMDIFIRLHCTEEQKRFVARMQEAIAEYVQPLMEQLRKGIMKGEK